MIQHIKIAGALLAAYGLAMSLLMGGIVLMMGGMTGLLAFIGVAEDPEALIAAGVYAVFTLFVAVVALVPPLGCLVGGVGLLMEKGWARIPAMLSAALVMLNVPLGTMLGLYVIYVLVQEDVTAHLAGETV